MATIGVFKHGDRSQETNEARIRVCPHGGSHDPKCAASWQVAMVHKVVFPLANLVGKPSMGALMEGRFERFCGLEEPL